MRCQSCDYPLWNLSTRTCPECGAPFRPDEFEFVPDSVRFRCPHCTQEYYGTGEKGHLDPVEFECVSCDRRIHMNEMVLEPREDLKETETRPGTMPWFERKHRGRIKAFFQTIGMAMVRPVRLINGVPADSSVGQALVYAFLTTLVLFLTGALVPGLIWMLAYYGVGGQWSGVGGFAWFFFLIPYFMFIPLSFLGIMLLWPMVTHLVLRLTGGSAHPVDRTFHAFAYSAGANVLTAIPCFGITFGWIWWLVSATVMVSVGQKVHPGRAILAVLCLPLMVIVLVVGGFGFGMWMQSQMMPGGTGFNIRTQSTMMIGQSVTQMSWQNNGQGPLHVIECMHSGQMYYFSANWSGSGATSTYLCHPDSNTTEADIPVGDGTLQEYLAASGSERLIMAAAQLDCMPEGVIAYRFGDYVFTYPGAQVNTMDPQLWMVVMLPDPDVNGEPGADDPIHIANANYGVQEATYGELAALLQQQNQYRATLKMPPLPDLITITHDTPAVASPTSAGDTSEEEE